MNEISDSHASSSLQYIHSWHYDMLVNQERSQFYNDLIRENCRDKVVFEIGTGSGLLAVLALKHGAARVICCEENPLLAMAARQLFIRLGVADRIELITLNSKDISTADLPPVDIILHELFGSDPFSEEMLPTLADARRFLKPDGYFLPEKVQLIYQPVPNLQLPEKLYFQDIELIEMDLLLSQVHPGLRLRNPVDPIPEGFALPEVSITQLLQGPYTFTEHNPELQGVDAVSVSFRIVHHDKKLQAAEFNPAPGRIHWYPLMFYKKEIASDQLIFKLTDQVRLTVS